MTKFLNIDLDTKLGGSTPSDVLVSSQKAIKTYVDSKLLEETTRAQGVETGLDTRVSGIEAKIPDSASVDNKLATKADLENVGVAVDDTTITKKADGKIQASAVVNQNSGVLKSWTGTLAEYNALETKSDDTIYIITDDDSEGVNVYTKSEVDDLLNNKQDTLVSGTNIKTINGETILGSGNIKIEASSSGGGVSVGTVFVTPRTGTIQGAVEANGNPYNIADYSGEGSIGALLTAGSIAYISKAEFQTQVTNTGACDSFGWDGASDTTFSVPKLKPWHVGKSAPVVGNGKGIELTGIGQNLSGSNPLEPQQNNVAIQQNTGVIVGLTTDPEKSGMIADLSETTNLRVMVQLATGATDQALETCTGVLADVAGLKDMSNVTATGKETVVGWGMPDYSAGIALSGWGTATSNFSVPTDGVLQIVISSTSALEEFFVDKRIVCALVNVSNYKGWAVNLFPVSKGTHAWRTSSTPSRIYAVVFYPFKGVN